MVTAGIVPTDERHGAARFVAEELDHERAMAAHARTDRGAERRRAVAELRFEQGGLRVGGTPALRGRPLHVDIQCQKPRLLRRRAGGDELRPDKRQVLPQFGAAGPVDDDDFSIGRNVSRGRHVHAADAVGESVGDGDSRVDAVLLPVSERNIASDHGDLHPERGVAVSIPLDEHDVVQAAAGRIELAEPPRPAHFDRFQATPPALRSD